MPPAQQQRNPVGRKRIHNRHLPKGVTIDYGTYWFRGTDRKRVRLGRTLAEAMETWATLIQPDPGPVPSMHDAFERYKREVLPKRADKTRRNQLYMFPVLEAVFGTMHPGKIKARHGYAYLAQRHAHSPTLAVKEFNLMSAVLTACVKWGAIDENPFWQVRKGEYTPAPRTRCPTEDEYAAVYALANERMQIAMDLALLTGLRRGGILRLELAGITDDGLLCTQPGKQTKALLFERTPALEAVLERARRLEPRVRRALLCTRTGHAYTADGFSAVWQRLMTKAVKQKAIVERFTYHDLRALSATSSVTSEAASERLGHSSVEMTKRVYIRKPTKVTPLR